MDEQANYIITLQDRFTSPLSKMESHMNRFESKLSGLGRTILGVFGGSILAGGVQGAVQGVKDLAFGIVKLGADMEQTRISFTTMLGSAEKAKSVIAELVKFAEITPFGQAEVITGAKQLLAYGFAAENLTTDLRRLGDVSAGLSIPLGDLVYLYGTIRTQGKAMTKDLMQFANRGIPIYAELTKVTGKSKDALQAMVEDGKIGFDVIEKAFINMTKEGSMFGGLMEKQSRSLIGRFSTLKDKILVMGTAIGESWIPGLGAILEWTIRMVEILPRLDFSPLTANFKQIGQEVSTLVDQLNQLLGVFGVSITEFEAATIALKYFAFVMRVAWTPIRVGIQLFTQLVTMVKNSMDVFRGLGLTLEGVFAKNTTVMKVGLKMMEDGFAKMTKEASGLANEFMHEEKKGWNAIFGSAAGSDQSKAFGGPGGLTAGSAAGGSTGKTKEAGVEKIKSGTRNITLNISQLVGEIKFEKSIEKSEAQMTEIVKRVLLTAVNDVNIVAD